MKAIYLDHAATTPLREEVLEAMMPYLTNQFGNASSNHGKGREARIAVERSRKTVAEILGVAPSTIIFTSGGTESNNTAIWAAVHSFTCNQLISSGIEHHAVVHPFENMSLLNGIKSSLVNVHADGKPNIEELEQQLFHFTQVGRKCFVTLMGANNETGALLDTKEVGKLCKKYQAIFHSDCVQTVGHYPVRPLDHPIHLLSAAGHKFGGPKGIGILYVDKGLTLMPLLQGGKQEMNKRAGTENVAGIVGFAKALELAIDEYEMNSKHIQSLKLALAEGLKDFEGVTFNGDPGEGLYTVLSVNFPKTEDTEWLILNLDKKCIYVSGGSACSGGRSHVMEILHPKGDVVTVRFSFAQTNTMEEVKRVVEVVGELLKVGVVDSSQARN